MEKVTITGIWRNTTDKQGNPLKSAKGFPYTKLSFKCKEHGDRYVGGFGNKDNEAWVVGSVVEVIIKENGQYLNFDMPKIENVLEDRVMKLESKVTTLDLSLERRVRELFAELKSDLVLETTGKFQTEKDFKEFQKPVPGFEPDDIPLEAYNDEPPF